MNREFWQRFETNSTANCNAWVRPSNPVAIPSGEALWKKRWTANPDFCEVGGRWLLYYRGHGVLSSGESVSHDRIGVAAVKQVRSSGIQIDDLNDHNPVLDVGDEGEFDSQEVLDPSAIVHNETVHLYYSAIGAGEDRVGLAVSADGINFEKKGPVLVGRAPMVVKSKGRISMLFQLKNTKGCYEVWLAQSDDGENFETVGQAPVFTASKGDGWDSFDVVTCRVYEGDDGWYYMIYGGSKTLIDQPDHFGLARSTDLKNWERHPGNPVFGLGPEGSEDAGAIWFPALHAVEDGWAMLYEGSRGTYSGDLSSQICFAFLPSSENSNINTSAGEH